LVIAIADWEAVNKNDELLGALIFGALIYPLAAWVFYRAGRSLAASVPQRSFRAPWLILTGFTVLASVVLLFWRPFVIPTGAMEDTLLIGDPDAESSYPRIRAVE